MAGFNSDVEVEVTVETLVGEMPDEACESPYHDKPGTFHNGPATHYAQLLHSCSFLPAGSIYTVCEPQATYMSNRLGSVTRFTTCASCGSTMLVESWAQIIGPIRKGKL